MKKISILLVTTMMLISQSGTVFADIQDEKDKKTTINEFSNDFTPIQDNPDFTLVDDITTVYVDSKHNFVPTFNGETEISYLSNNSSTLKEVTKTYWSVEGKYLQISSNANDSVDADITFHNIGLFNNKKVNLILTITSDDSDVFLGIDNTTFLNALLKTPNKNLKMNMQYVDDLGNPMNVGGHLLG